MKMNIRVKFNVAGWTLVFFIWAYVNVQFYLKGGYEPFWERGWFEIWGYVMILTLFAVEAFFSMKRKQFFKRIECELYMLKGYTNNLDGFTIQCENIGKLIHDYDKIRLFRVYNKRTGIDKYSRINAWIKNGRKSTTEPLILLYMRITDPDYRSSYECCCKEVADARTLKATEEKRLETQYLSTEERACAIAELKKEMGRSISKSEQRATVENTQLADEYWKLFVTYKMSSPSTSRA